MGKAIIIVIAIVVIISVIAGFILMWYAIHAARENAKAFWGNSDKKQNNDLSNMTVNILVLSSRIKKLENQYKEFNSWANEANNRLNELENKQITHHKTKSKNNI